MTLDAHKDRTAIRLKLYQNGFTPLANKMKLCLLPEWSTFKVDPERIQSREWARSGRFLDTGIRCGDVVALDWDIDDPDLLNDLLDEIVNRKLVDESPFVRIGRPPRELWVYRTSEKIGKRTTGHFVPAGAPDDHKGFAVEILGAGCQFAAYGQRDETTAYQWPEESLLDHTYMDLPEITKAQADAIKDFAIAFFDERGLERRSPAGGTDAGYTLAYDLTPEMVFEVHDMGEMTLDEIEAALKASPEGEVFRCKVEALRPTGGSWAGMISLVNGMVCVSDHGTYTSHFPLDADMHRHVEKLGALLAARFPETLELTADPETAPRDIDLLTILDPRQPLDASLGIALKRFVYIENENTVHDLRRPKIGMSADHFRTRMAQYYADEPVKSGIKKVTRLADLWLQHPDRINVASIGMRPDRAWPLFEENGAAHLNTYKPAIFPDNLGDGDFGFDFIARLLPIESERVYFLRWLSYKYQHPEVRGPGIIMVAHERYGTGRGSLINLIRAMFTDELVQNIDFKTLSGQTYQSQYNEWLADSLIVAVDEAQEVANTVSKWQAKSNAYEHLKTIVDPGNHAIQVVRKGSRNGPGRTFASVIVLTNHADALILPANDRRFSIIENGENQTQEFWDDYNLWVHKPENIAAFVAGLVAYPLGDYSPYALPPMTAAKHEMVDAGVSELDKAMDAVLADLPAPLVVKEQVVLRIEAWLADNDVEVADDWRRVVERMLLRRSRKVPLGVTERVRIDGRQRLVRVVGKINPEAFQDAANVVNTVLLNGPLTRQIKSSNSVVAFPTRR